MNIMKLIQDLVHYLDQAKANLPQDCPWQGEAQPTLDQARGLIQDTSAYTRTFHEVHVSEDGQTWSRSSTFGDHAQGLKEAQAYQAKLLKNTRHVRVCHVTRVVKVLDTEVNENLLSRQQIRDLLTRGTAAIQGIAGLSIHEGFDMSLMGDHGPTRVSISFDAQSVLGKYPRPTASDTNARREAIKQKRMEWNKEAEAAMLKALRQAELALETAGIKYVRSGQAIHLKP